MSTPQNVSPSNRLHTAAVILASLIVPAPIITGRIVEAIMDSSNPARLKDLTAPLAYLSEILVSSFVVLGIVIIAFIIATIMLLLRDRSWRAVSLPITVAILQIVLGILALVLGQAITVADGS